MENTFLGVNIIPANDKVRLDKLQEYEILDTPAEGAFNHIASMAANMYKVPIALISLVDKERVWFKANVGMEGVEEVSRGTSLCSLAILNSEPTVFNNALEEPCLLANPLVAGGFGLRFYAGAPLTTADGFHIGTLCLVDTQPRDFSEDDQKVLQQLAAIVMDEIELRYLRKKTKTGQSEDTA